MSKLVKCPSCQTTIQGEFFVPKHRRNGNHRLEQCIGSGQCVIEGITPDQLAGIKCMIRETWDYHAADWSQLAAEDPVTIEDRMECVLDGWRAHCPVEIAQVFEVLTNEQQDAIIRHTLA